ncbi:ArnT family glycosyltransferase [Mycolicibacterium mengxianglii]|uniref:ArnT family glycosyltransferase n=1 Tax=Mycolicibacterium mengxianglii TaxID=2736649 RepID=UPI003556D4E6
MTITAPRTQPSPAPAVPAGRRRSGAALALLLVGTAVLYLWNLGASGWANSFYTAAVQAGSSDWTAFLFGSSDAANAITVDKTPAALWVMSLSARLFGFSAWSVLVPQALMGVAAVAVLYAAVRRVSGPNAALLAGTVLALTPVAALMFRFNNPDALLVLSLVVAAYAVQRALDRDAGTWWLVLAGTALGVGFLAKMLQALLVAPVFALVFLLAADVPLRSRVRRLLAGTVALVVSAGWYLALVELWPADSRPYIGGSQQNSILELTFGYNGLGRLTGDEVGGLGNLNHDVGWGRLLGGQMGGEIGWLLPAAVLALIAGLWLTRRAPRTDGVRAALLLWGGWLVLTAVVFSYMSGIAHPYYTVALAPAIAACIGIGVPLLWHRRGDIRAATVLGGGVVITVVLSFVLLQRHSDFLPWLRWTVVVLGLTAGLLLLVTGRFVPSAARAVAAAALITTLAGPAAFTVATAATPHSGAIPSAGPNAGFGGPPGFLDAVRPGAELTALLRENATDYTWVAAAVGSNNAAGYQLTTGLPVMAVGGYNGTDPAPTLDQFQALVAAGHIHYFMDSTMLRMMGAGAASGSDSAHQIAEWVHMNFPSEDVDGVTVYDVSR